MACPRTRNIGSAPLPPPQDTWTEKLASNLLNENEAKQFSNQTGMDRNNDQRDTYTLTKTLTTERNSKSTEITLSIQRIIA